MIEGSCFAIYKFKDKTVLVPSESLGDSILEFTDEQFAELHRAMILWFTNLTIKNLEGQP